MALTEPRWDEARAALATAVRPLAPVRHVLAVCDGLVLAEDLVALSDLPSFDTSAMDGWAVAGHGPWTVVGQSLAGRPVPGPLTPGQAVVIATGGVVPPGAGAVIRSEDGEVQVRAGAEVLSAPTPDGSMHVRPAGEECAAGEVVARAGTVLNPALIGLAAAAGHDDLLVVPAPQVALVLFGDELATTGVPAQGLVRDSLGPQVPAWVARMGADVVLIERCEDTLAAHVEAIGRAASAADVVLTTGGTAAGPVDHLHAAIAQCGGEVVIDSVAVRPGHPMLAATLDRGRAWLVGLPGNPQSAIVTLMSLGAPILAGLAGRPALPELAEVPSARGRGRPCARGPAGTRSHCDGGVRPGQPSGLRDAARAGGSQRVRDPAPRWSGRRGSVRWLPLP